jgi:hypothetical protein
MTSDAKFWGVLVIAPLFAIGFLPPILVHEASHRVRMWWLAYAVISVLVLLITSFALRKEPNNLRKTYADNFSQTYMRRLKAVSIAQLITSAATILLMIQIVNLDAIEKPWASLGEIAIMVAHPLPVIQRYDTDIPVAMSSLVTFKVKAIVALAFILALECIAAVVALICIMSRRERCALLLAQAERFKARNWSGLKVSLCVPFALFMAFSALFGWSEFDPPTPENLRKFCIITVACYAQDNLMIIAAALSKALMATLGIVSPLPIIAFYLYSAPEDFAGY